MQDIKTNGIEMPDGKIKNKVDCIITDPPYGINYLSQMTDNHHKLVADDFATWRETFPRWVEAMSEVITDTGVACVCAGGGGKLPVAAIATLEAKKYFNLIQTVIWEKDMGLGWRYRPCYETILILSKSEDKYAFYDTSRKCKNLIKYRQYIPQKGEHPTQKPISLIYHFLRIHTKTDDVVLDPFMGSGTTAVAARKMGRHYIGAEIAKDYYDMAQKRIKDEFSQISFLYN